jgi:hypothetical protein
MFSDNEIIMLGNILNKKVKHNEILIGKEFNVVALPEKSVFQSLKECITRKKSKKEPLNINMLVSHESSGNLYGMINENYFRFTNGTNKDGDFFQLELLKEDMLGNIKDNLYFYNKDEDILKKQENTFVENEVFYSRAKNIISFIDTRKEIEQHTL